MLSIYLSILENEEQKLQFEEIYINYRSIMYTVAYNILHNSYDAEDAVHQAFLVIANNFKKVSMLSSQKIKPYLVIVIRNVSINIYNKNKNISDKTAEISDDTISVEIDFFERFRYEELLESISRLDDKYRDVLYLRYVNDFSVKEISKMLNMSEESIWKRIERAKKQLKELLERGE